MRRVCPARGQVNFVACQLKLFMRRGGSAPRPSPHTHTHAARNRERGNHERAARGGLARIKNDYKIKKFRQIIAREAHGRHLALFKDYRY